MRFSNQKLANFCTVGPAFVRACVRSTSRGRGGRSPPSGGGPLAGRAAAGVVCCRWEGCRAGARAGRRGSCRPHRGGGAVIVGGDLKEQGQTIRTARCFSAGRWAGDLAGGRRLRAGRKRKTGRAGRVWSALPVVLSAAVVFPAGAVHLIGAALAVIRSPRFHVSRNAAGVHFTPCRGGAFSVCRRGQILYLPVISP